MKAQRFLAHCLAYPWAMEPTTMALYAGMLMRAYARREGVAAGGMDEDDHGAPLKPSAAARTSSARRGSIAVVRVFGTIVQRASQLGPCEGGTGTEEIGAAIDAALADETVSQILMVFDTPGGSVFGVAELGDKIRSARGQKPIIGIADSMAASAGYWLLSQCSKAYCTPGGMVGSIGVYGAHEDVSKALAEMGVAVTLVSAGKFKVEGNPFEPLGEEARAYMQKSIDTYYGSFTSAVARGRGVPVDQVRTGMGEGRCLSAADAKAAGMVDDVMTFDQVVQSMVREQKPRGGRSALAAAKADLEMLS